MMRDPPLVAISVAKKFRARHEEDAPALNDAPSFRPVVAFKDAKRVPTLCVDILQPRFGGLRIMLAWDPPPILNRERRVQLAEHRVRRHHAAREEFSGHPIAAVCPFEGIRKIAMRKDVEEHLAIFMKPSVATTQEGWPISHMLKHLNRDNAVKVTIGLKFNHVTGNHSKIGESPLSRFGLDIFPLRI